MRLRTTEVVSVALILSFVSSALGARVETSADSTVNDPAPESGAVVARVNGEPLYVEDVASVLNEIHSGVEAMNRSDFDLDSMLFRLVNDTLFAQEARVLGYDEDPVIERKVEAQIERLATRRLRYEEITSQIELDSEELERIYDEVFRTATLRIVTRKDRSEAEALRKELDDGADFETMARERSQDPYAGRGGLMNEVVWLDLPRSIAELAFSMTEGEIAGPVATGLGWTVFRVEDLQPADPERFDGRKGEVRDVLRFRQEEVLRSQLLERLRELHPVVVDEAVYDSIGVEMLQDGRLVPDIEDPDAVVVTAGGRAITASEFGRSLADRWQAIGNRDVALAIKPILLDRMTVDQLMTAEAFRLGYHELPEIQRRANALETRLLVKRYMEEVVAAQVDVDRSELESYYTDHRDQFRKPPLLFVSQMTLTSQEQAERMIELLRQGTEFAWLARKHSTDGFAESGGSVGWVRANEGHSGFQSELSEAKVGDIFGPKGGGVDWRIIQITAVEDQGYYGFDQVSGNVRSRVEERAFFALVETYVERLRGRSEIWIDRDAIESLQLSAEQKQDPGGHATTSHGEI